MPTLAYACDLLPAPVLAPGETPGKPTSCPQPLVDCRQARARAVVPVHRLSQSERSLSWCMRVGIEASVAQESSINKTTGLMLRRSRFCPVAACSHRAPIQNKPRPHADIYLQDEVQFAFHPTLTRIWYQKGRRGQRFVEAPGANDKVYGFGLVDWCDGWFDGRLAPSRTAEVFRAQVRAAVERSQARPHRLFGSI